MHLIFKTILTFLLFFSISFGKAQSIDRDKLLKHLEYLSSDELIGRETLTEGNREAQKYLINYFSSIGLETQYPDFQQKFTFQNKRKKQTYEDAVNIVGFIGGKSSRKLIVVTAHYDHVGIGRAHSGDSIYNGADDNASGTATLLALAEYFSKNRPEHSMIFAALDAEEMGLQGAKALVLDFPFPLDQILVNVNMDMVSRNDKGEIYASGTHQNPNLKPILEKATSGLTPKLMFGHDLPNTGSDNWTQSSDHGAFYDKGVPHIYFGVEDHKDYHKPSDEFRNIQPEFFYNAANLILKSIIALDRELPKE
jgi:Zn-dependent M28 family amino/carboxypeptidase